MDFKEIMDSKALDLLSDEELESLANSSEEPQTFRTALNELRARESKHLNRRLNFLSDRIKTLLRKETQLSVVHSFGTALLTKHILGAKLQEAQWNDQVKSNRAQLKILVE